MNESEYYAGEFTDTDLNALADAGEFLAQRFSAHLKPIVRKRCELPPRPIAFPEQVLTIIGHYEATKSGDYRPLRIFAKVPRVKIREYHQTDDPILSDEDIAKILAIGPAENLLGQLRASWTDLSCLEILPAELHGRDPDSIENDIAFWIVDN
jgi:hypothetical protein